MEVYVDHLIFKSKKISDLHVDMVKTFQRIRIAGMRMKPKKYVFGVPSGKCLGFIVSKWGIEANLAKIKAIQEIQTLRSVKDVQKLSECVAYLSRFM